MRCFPALLSSLNLTNIAYCIPISSYPTTLSIYQAWMDPSSRLTFYNNACAQKKQIALMEREFGPVIVGEWSLATDNCASKRKLACVVVLRLYCLIEISQIISLFVFQ